MKNNLGPGEFICARKGCDLVATRKTHNQKYCTDECCRLATNARIMEKYYDRKAQKSGKKRFCQGCRNELSKYNNTLICSSCTIKSKSVANAFATSIVSNSSIIWYD